MLRVYLTEQILKFKIRRKISIKRLGECKLRYFYISAHPRALHVPVRLLPVGSIIGISTAVKRMPVPLPATTDCIH
jgi:hypothetical protein